MWQIYRDPREAPEAFLPPPVTKQARNSKFKSLEDVVGAMPGKHMTYVEAGRNQKASVKHGSDRTCINSSSVWSDLNKSGSNLDQGEAEGGS